MRKLILGIFILVHLVHHKISTSSLDGIGCGDLNIPKIRCYFYVNAPIYFFILFESSSIYTGFIGWKVELVTKEDNLPLKEKAKYFRNKGENMGSTEIINQICIQYLEIDFLNNPNLANKSFFSKEINAMPRDIMIIMLKIEKTLNLRFSDDFIKKGGIKSFKSIIDYING